MGIISYIKNKRRQNKIKWTFIYIGLSLLFISCIVVPVCYIVSLNIGENDSPESFGKKQCGLFSYNLILNSDYCVCDNNDVYDVNTKEFMFNKNNALSNIITSYAEGNLDKFNLDYENGEKFLIIVTRDDCDVCVKQIIALKNSLVNKKVNVHYINVDKLLKNDEYKINSIVDNKINNSDIYFVVIDDKQVIYKTCKYLNEEEIDKLLNEYDLIKNN